MDTNQIAQLISALASLQPHSQAVVVDRSTVVLGFISALGTFLLVAAKWINDSINHRKTFSVQNEIHSLVNSQKTSLEEALKTSQSRLAQADKDKAVSEASQHAETVAREKSATVSPEVIAQIVAAVRSALKE